MLPYDDPDTPDPQFTPARRIEFRSRNELGRFLHEERLEPHPDECLSPEEVVLGLRNLWFHGKKGSKAALARATGFKDRQQLSALLRGKAPLHEPIRRRCSRFLTLVRSGEMHLVSTGFAHRSGSPTFEWKRRGIERASGFAWSASGLKTRDRRALDDWT